MKTLSSKTRMTYLTPTRRKNTFRSTLLFPACIVFGILFLVSIFFFSGVSSFFISASSGMKSFFSSIPLIQYFESKTSLSRENDSLKKQINTLISKQENTDVLREENLSLYAALGKKSDNLVYATVLSKPAFSPYDTLVLDASAAQGVIKGNKVFYGNIAIGEIDEVDSSLSRASLFSTSGKTFQAKIGSKKIDAEAVGQGGGMFEILLPKAVTVTLHDPVFLPEESSKVFGYIEGIVADEGNVFQKIFFSLPVNPFEIDEVYIKI